MEMDDYKSMIFYEAADKRCFVILFSHRPEAELPWDVCAHIRESVRCYIIGDESNLSTNILIVIVFAVVVIY